MLKVKLNATKVIVTFFILICWTKVQAKEYYVAKDGSDTNPGTQESPFLTIAKASENLLSGDVCIIKKGIYREVITPIKAGTSSAPIIYKSFAGDTVTISACDPIGSWQTYNGNSYKTSVDMPLGIEANMLYADGTAMEIARWPNDKDNNKFTIDAEPVDNGSASSIIRSTIPSIDWTGGFVWYLGAHSGTSWTRPITSSSAGQVNFTAVDITKWPFKPHNPTYYENGNRGRFFLFGKLEALDIAREWYYDMASKTLYFMPPDGKNPNQMDTEYAAREKTAAINKNYIELDGLHLFGGRVHITSDHCILKNCVVEYGFQSLDELDNTNTQIPYGSVTIEGSYNLIDHNLIENGSANGIALTYAWKGSTNNTINNNIIRNFNTIGNHSSPIVSSTPYLTITNNTIYNTGRDGIGSGGINCEIAYNDVSECMLINNDGGTYYTTGNANDKNTRIHHNWFHDSTGPSYADGRTAGIYLDNNSKGYVVDHNVVWNITWSAVQMSWDNWNISIFNNSFYNVSAAMGRWANGHTIKNMVVKNNYASINDWIGTDISPSSNVINSNSPFNSIDQHEFWPTPGSYLIDKGEEIAGITDGFQGAAPDVGAYESGAEHWIPGADWFVEPLQGGTTAVKPSPGNNKPDFKAYPNPATNEIYIQNPTYDFENTSISLYTLTGTEVNIRGRLSSSVNGARITLFGLQSGMYFIKIRDPKTTYTVSFLKH